MDQLKYNEIINWVMFEYTEAEVGLFSSAMTRGITGIVFGISLEAAILLIGIKNLKGYINKVIFVRKTSPFLAGKNGKNIS